MVRFRSADRATTRAALRRAVRRGIGHVPVLDRAAVRAAGRRGLHQRLLSFYETMRSTYAAGDVASSAAPSEADIAAVRTAILRTRTSESFFDMLCADGDFERAAVTTTRRLIARRGRARAVSIFQALQRYDELRPVADICLALCALNHPMPDTAWALLTRNDLGLVMRCAPEEYFQLAFLRDQPRAADALRRVLSGEIPIVADSETWLNIAYESFSADAIELAGEALAKADAAMAGVTDNTRAKKLRPRLATLREWLDRAAAARQPVPDADGEVPFAVVGYKHPDWREMSCDLDDPLESLAALGHVLRHNGVTLTGDTALVSAAERLRQDVPPERRIDSDNAVVHLYEIERDMSRHAAVPDGTWAIVSEWFTVPLSGRRYDLPLNPNLRPIFISFHTTPAALAGPGAVEYLRKYAPIGCADWDTVFLLQAAGVPAFMSGPLTTTIDNVIARAAGARPASGRVLVDTTAQGPGERRSQLVPEMKRWDLGKSLAAAAERLREHRDGGKRVVTSSLRLYLAARAVGCPARFRPPRGGRRYRYVDFVDLPDDKFRTLQRGIDDKLAAILAAVLAGRPDTEVYKIWRELCAPDVDQAEVERHRITGQPRLLFDLERACAVIRAAAVTVERSAPVDGPEVNVEFSLDGNYKHQLDVVLDSVIEHTRRPVRAFVLCRGHEQSDFERMARLFPTVSFVWLPTDDVDYGRVGGMNPWVTPATMDRTIMPALLDDVHRIIHFDLDALCLSDLAELFDVDMEGTAIAGATSPQPRFRSGFETIRRNAERLRQEGRPELARELILRTHAEHALDFDVFNAGIMVFDLDKMRADDFCGRILPYVQRFGLNGQVVLNVYVGRHRKVVSNAWNRLIRLEADEARNAVHWVGQFKPWRGDVYVTGRELWQAQEQRFAARTAYAGSAAATVK